MFQFSESTLPSEPKNHINLKLPDLRLVLERTVYMPGETVTGSVIFNVGNPLSLKHITLQLYGAEHAEWTESHTESRTDSDARLCTKLTRKLELCSTWIKFSLLKSQSSIQARIIGPSRLYCQRACLPR
jgi:hypothetical protein